MSTAARILLEAMSPHPLSPACLLVPSGLLPVFRVGTVVTNLALRRIWLFLACIFPVAGALSFYGAAMAQPSRRFTLQWQAPAGCATEADVIREIEGLVANSAADTPNITIAANASVESDHGGFTLTLIVRDVEGSHGRRLEAPTCEELGHAAALIVALAIDPALLATQSIPSGTTTFTPPTGPSVEPNSAPLPNAPPSSIPITGRAETPATSAVPDASNEPLLWRLGLSAFVGYKTLPGVNLGTGVFGAIQTRSFHLELAVSSLTGEATSEKSPRRSATLALYRIAPRVCWFVTEKTWSAGPCAGIELGRVSGQGYGVSQPEHANELWFASTLGGLLELRIASSTLLGVFVDLEAPLESNEFRLAGESLFKTAVSARFGLSLVAGWH